VLPGTGNKNKALNGLHSCAQSATVKTRSNSYSQILHFFTPNVQPKADAQSIEPVSDNTILAKTTGLYHEPNTTPIASNFTRTFKPNKNSNSL